MSFDGLAKIKNILGNNRYMNYKKKGKVYKEIRLPSEAYEEWRNGLAKRILFED